MMTNPEIHRSAIRYSLIVSLGYNPPISLEPHQIDSTTVRGGQGMETEHSGKNIQQRTHRHTGAVILLEFGIVLVLSSLILMEYFHNVFLQDYVRNTILSNASILEIAVPVGFLAITVSLILQRKRDDRDAQAALRREEILRKIKFAPTTLLVQNVPHQLFTIPRPARDTQFRIKKTRNKGKIARNSGGQRTSPEDKPEN